MDRPLRFCMITTFYPPYNLGGDGIFVQRLANGLAERGHQVEVIHCIDAHRLMAGHVQLPARAAQHPNLIVHALKSPFGFLSPLATQQTGYPFFKSASLKRILKRGFDVIHYHNVSLVGGPKILEYGEGIKLYTMHEYWLVCPNHLLLRPNRTICKRPSCFLCTLAHQRPPQWWRYSGLLRKSATHVDAFLALSRFARDIHYRMGFHAPIVHLPGFAPPQTVSLTSGKEIGRARLGKPYFLFVGRLNKVKGLQTLIPVFRRYPQAGLLIAGKGPDEKALRQMAHGLDHIRFLGHLSETELTELYEKAVALVVPSLCYEASPLVILEAFRSQTPVIARDLGGTPELVEESGGGFVYSTAEDLVGAMDQLLSDPSCRQEMGLKGHQAYLRNWTIEAHLRHYFNLIDEISSRRSGHTAGRVPEGEGGSF